MQALGHDPDELEMVIVQLVQLLKGGEPVRLSKRTGDLIELRDVLDEVGPDATRLTYLLQSIDSPQTFDLDVVTSQGNDNPVFYVQMAFARIRSIARVARRARRRPGAARRRSTARCWPTSASSTCCASSRCCPRWWPTRPRDRAPHHITTWVARAGRRRCTASTTTATCWVTRSAPS